MKRILPILALPVLAVGLVSCSSADSNEEAPQFRPQTTESTATSSAEASSPETTAEETTESDKKVDDSGLTMRSAEDFLAKGPEYAQSKAWGVKSPDEKVWCSFNELSEGPWCTVQFADPPLMPDPNQPQWEANMVSFKKGEGFFPSGVVDPGDLTPPKQLKAGEKVEIEGATFEAPNSDEFTVTAKGHYFTVKDNGQYFSDTFLPKPDSNGNGKIGTICGQIDTKWGRKNVYVQVDGTNCTKAMQVVDSYVNHDFKPEEVNTRGSLNVDGWQCDVSAPKFLDDAKPENRLPKCLDMSGSGRVVLLDT